MYLKKVAGLFLGSLLAQLIPLLSAPLLSRLYTPEQFGSFGFFSALFSLISVLATMRYELTINIPKSNRLSNVLFVLSIWCAFFVFLILLFLFLMLPIFIDKNPGNIFLIPVAVFFWGVTQSYSFWNNRRDRFKIITRARLIQNVAMTGFQCATSLFIPLGLECGFTFGLLNAIFYYYYATDKIWNKQFNKAVLFSAAKKFRYFPIYNSFSTVLDAAACQLPLLIVTIFYKDIAGLYFFASKIITVPVGFLIIILHQIDLNKIGKIKSNTHLVKKYIMLRVGLITLIGLPLAGILVPFLPDLFFIFFGKQWGFSGVLAQYLIISGFIRLLIAPLGSYFIVYNQIKYASIWQSYSFFTTLGVSYFFLHNDIKTLIIAYVINDVLSYSIYFFLILYSLRRRTKISLVSAN